MSDAITQGQLHWRIHKTVDARSWEITAWLDVGNRLVHFGETPVAPAARAHEGGGARYTIEDFRDGAASGWDARHPHVYRRVAKAVDHYFPARD